MGEMKRLERFKLGLGIRPPSRSQFVQHGSYPADRELFGYEIRHLALSATCRLCNGDDESMVHECPGTRDIWNLVITADKMDDFMNMPTESWLLANVNGENEFPMDHQNWGYPFPYPLLEDMEKKDAQPGHNMERHHHDKWNWEARIRQIRRELITWRISLPRWLGDNRGEQLPTVLHRGRMSGILVAALVLSWALLFRSSFLPHSPVSSQEDPIFVVLHPLLMVIGFILISAILVHRWLPGSRNLKKAVHLWLQGGFRLRGFWDLDKVPWTTRPCGADDKSKGVAVAYLPRSLHLWLSGDYSGNRAAGDVLAE
ncbi:putative transmembrane ascorbate ferrireductase 4 [Hibiscus syriacus]|uniref:Transmembrane ascorbate ferrireductase 4 n=1 Tax=Hibiscus syriacus TaxID=106335 RepID=A0A6A3ARZ3_HIBSY|nr:putative transmembrane ascorbate ferrireductase 4 [Hibiscus syriacus]